MKNNERNAGRIPYYGKGNQTEILRVLILSDAETKEKMTICNKFIPETILFQAKLLL